MGMASIVREMVSSQGEGRNIENVKGGGACDSPENKFDDSTALLTILSITPECPGQCPRRLRIPPCPVISTEKEAHANSHQRHKSCKADGDDCDNDVLLHLCCF
jgi:hypothetical protein